MSKRPFVPSFINRLDAFLLKKHPETWSARTHLVLYFGLLFILLLAALSFTLPDDPRSDSPAPYWITFMIIVSVISLVLWLMFLFRFNVFKRFGISGPSDRLKVFLLYLASTLTIVFFPYVKPLVETIRANQAYGEEELVNDINRINIALCRLGGDSLDHRWSYDTLRVKSPVGEQGREEQAMYTVSRYNVVTPEELTIRYDSIRPLDSGLYVVSTCPDYVFVDVHYYFGNATAKSKLLSSKQLYDLLFRHPINHDRKAAREEMALLAKKYSHPANSRYQHADESYAASVFDEGQTYTYSYYLKKHYNIASVYDSFRNILTRKYRWDRSNIEWQLRLLLYWAFIGALLVFVFRHTTVRTFFLSLLTAFLLSMLTSLFMVIVAAGGSSGMSFSGVFVFYVAVFLFIGLAGMQRKTRSTVTGIAINLFTLLIPFVPLVLASWYVADHSYREAEGLMRMAEIAGPVLFLVLLPTLIHRLYRGWYAQPEN